MWLLITLLFCLITISSAQNRIIGGTDVSAGTYPWFAHAISGNCGGMLIAANWILTAAHCPVPSTFRNFECFSFLFQFTCLFSWFASEYLHKYSIGSYVIGALDYSDASNGGQFLQVISVSQTFQHPLYGNSNYTEYSFDFRLNKLERSSSITPVDIDSDGLSDSYRNGRVGFYYLLCEFL
jgi:secreted trypsin-like serine protease